MKAAQPAFQNNGLDTLEYIKRDIDPKTGLMYEQAEYSSVTIPEQYKDFAFGATAQQGAYTDIEFADDTYAMARIVRSNYFTSDSVKFKAQPRWRHHRSCTGAMGMHGGACPTSSRIA